MFRVEGQLAGFRVLESPRWEILKRYVRFKKADAKI